MITVIFERVLEGEEGKWRTFWIVDCEIAEQQCPDNLHLVDRGYYRAKLK